MKAKNHTSNPGLIVGQKRRRKPVARKTTDRLQKRIEPHSEAGMLPVLPVSDEKLQKYFHIFAIVILLAFGSYISIQFYGLQIVPNSDFPAFSQTAREIFSFKQPSSFKRTPGLGMLHVMASYLMPGAHPLLTAGWVLNAVFHALTAVLLYLVGRELVGYSAIWYALLITVNPWVIAWMTHPLAETPLIFFVLLTFYLTFKHSRWSYAAAMMASMIRYEGAAMIAIAFVGDIIHSKTWRPILWAFLAAVPVFLVTLLQIIPSLANLIKIPLPDFSSLYNLMRFAIVFPFFAAGVVYLIVHRNLRWGYLAAGIASLFSLLAGVILIVAVFGWDLYKSGVWRKTLPRLLLVILASLPIALWLYGTKRTRMKDPGAKDYSTGYSPAKKMVIGKFSDYVWQLGVSSYFVDGQVEMPIPGYPGRTKIVFTRVTRPSQLLFVLCVISALGYAIYKKHVPALLVFSFLAVYFLAHATRNGTRPRYGVPIAWVNFLIAWYGLKQLWSLIQPFWKIPRYLCVVLQFFLILAVTAWLGFMPKISELEGYSYYSVYKPIPYVAITVIVLLFLARFLAYRGKTFVRDVALSMLVCLMLISNQFILTPLVGSGNMDAEFKELADWARNPENVKPDEKLVTTMPHVVEIFAPKIKPNLVGTGDVVGNSPSNFAQRCQFYDAAFVAWDSRLGYALTNSYYHALRMRYLRLWSLPKETDYGPFTFVHKIGPNRFYPNRFINIFRVERLTGDVSKAPEFQLLADWHMNLDEKYPIMVSARADILRQLVPETKYFFWHTGSMWGRTPSQFLQACYRNQVKYIAWDSRSSLNRNDPHYEKWGLYRIQPLRHSKNAMPYEFVTQLKHENGEYINIFRLDVPPLLQRGTLPEFKLLGDWYRTNASFPEKTKRPKILITSVPDLMRKWCLYNDDYFWHTSSILGNTADDFLRSCHFNHVHYIAWDSYNGNNTETPHYKKWRLDRIKMLSKPQSFGPYQFEKQFKINDEHYINLFSLKQPEDDNKK